METVYRSGTNEVLHESREGNNWMYGAVWTEERRESLPFWDVRCRLYNADGIHIGACEAEVHEHIRITTGYGQPQPGLVFLQQGHVTATAHAGGRPQAYGPMQHGFFRNPYTTLNSEFPKQQLKVLLITFSPERFLQLAQHAGPAMERLAHGVAGDTVAQYPGLPVTPRMQALIGEILQCRYAGGWQHLFLQAKALELLALQCEQLEGAAKKNPVLRAADVDRIYAARETLLSDIQHPPSLTALAKTAGLNEYKLKAGFREVFGNTVFGYLKDHRLTLARQLLLDGGKTVTEVAYETGYSTLQHFSNEFKRKFGISPGQLATGRKSVIGQ